MSDKASAERFGEVVLPHLSDALALARWLTGNADDAEDVVQEACLKAHKGLATYAGGNARAWLLTIVRNVSYAWLARNHPRRIVAVGDLADLDALAATAETGADTPEAALIAKADAAALEAAIMVLPHPFREVLVLRDINGLSYREIAAMLHVPLGTVMSRLSRARRLLISELGGKR
ncbi:sigma-70 family RNA polymerase sigma factor [Bosea sp. F3-2]|uniref:sigma-70 family RNA polymerase sigma factor n=1 Tax=Bosea sp. F3-2 TaxID=2599640 RepID=UPI0011ECFE03|nr:sigma-70 family RNA polymerase sigma factor [Bosea sp. F3-2]QEL24924.1 sigma-70 family RNA polymerase sigma factor [Bosea sp. F3-2]